MTLRLVIFDVDGTLIDSQAQITAAMATAFATEGLDAPPMSAVRGIIGLSLPLAISELAPGLKPDAVDRLVAAYKTAYVQMRVNGGGEASSPMFDGARDALDILSADDNTLLGIATGKAQRGLDHLFSAHDLAGYFVTTQVADHHPSKPHPSMVLQCLAETGVEAENAVILGDTTFDMEMGRAAGIHALGVNWGYHPAEALSGAGARRVLNGFADLLPALDEIWRRV